MDFIYVENVLEIGTEVMSEWVLTVNTAKVEWTQLILAEEPKQCGWEEWRSAKSLGSLLGDSQDMSQRKQLAGILDSDDCVVPKTSDQ